MRDFKTSRRQTKGTRHFERRCLKAKRKCVPKKRTFLNQNFKCVFSSIRVFLFLEGFTSVLEDTRTHIGVHCHVVANSRMPEKTS